VSSTHEKNLLQQIFSLKQPICTQRPRRDTVDPTFDGTFLPIFSHQVSLLSLDSRGYDNILLLTTSGETSEVEAQTARTKRVFGLGFDSPAAARNE
jgi:hypothetical protein